MIYITTYPLTQRINPMRKLLLTTAAVAAAIGLAGCGSGTLIDERDGQKYRTVVIGGDRWMAQNLNYKTDSSWCYKNNADANSCKKYGRVYAWNAANKACPAGYHLSSRQEWDRLVATAGGEKIAGKKLKAKSGWSWNDRNRVSGDGTDNYGFSALSTDNGDYNGIWWTPTESSPRQAICRVINFTYDYVDESHENKSLGLSVRCVADNP